jgi:hypothetical protein
MGVGLGALRHLDLTGRPAVHSLHLESVCHQCRPISCCDTASQLLTQKALQEACSPYDTRCMACSSGNHLSSNLWLVSSFVIMALECPGIQARRLKMYHIKDYQENIWPGLKGCDEGVWHKILLVIWAMIIIYYSKQNTTFQKLELFPSTPVFTSGWKQIWFDKHFILFGILVYRQNWGIH